MEHRTDQGVGAAIILGTIGVLSFIVQPGLVQGFVTQYGLSEASANEMAFMEMLGIAVGTVLAALIGPRLSWRTQTVAALLVAALGYVLSGMAAGGDLLPLARMVAGFGSGFIISISFSVVGSSSQPERNMGLYLVLLLTYGALGLWAMPSILDSFGLGTVFYSWAIASLAASAVAWYLPDVTGRAGDVAHDASGDGFGRASTTTIVFVLAGVLVYNVSIGVAWANLFLIGIDAGIAEQPIANGLLICQFTAVGGALGAVWWSERISRFWPIVVGTVGGAAALALTLGTPGYGAFLVTLIAFNTLWNFALPFILGLAASLTPSGRLMSTAIASQMIGLAFGPLAASELLGGADSFEPVKILSIAAMILSLALFAWPLLVRREAVPVQA
ncbi:MFS transporter [Altericroceibacterium xinjiangense]|uniref:MFS transporter n=1 Tax=Altericroceibacterium xinjiangense TaxID=762261 RepID=UPI000F7E65DB|nr:MFS transporter [Altericroceibacterium xinjiangense]